MIYLTDLITATGADLRLPGRRDVFDAFAHDSRQVTAGEVFVAVRGERGDGHDYLRDAAHHGAAALLAEDARLSALLATDPTLLALLAETGVALLVVADTRDALRRYARYILDRWHPRVIAVTGSTGKTTTKEAIATALSRGFATFRSWRNYNDLLGLPLSLGRLEPRHEFAVLELGGDHPGEIAALSALARPWIAIVTNISPTQLQYFGTLDRLAAEFLRLPESLSPDGWSILNGDDPFLAPLIHTWRHPTPAGSPDTPSPPAQHQRSINHPCPGPSGPGSPEGGPGGLGPHLVTFGRSDTNDYWGTPQWAPNHSGLICLAHGPKLATPAPLSPTLFSGSTPRDGGAALGTPPAAASSPPRSGERAQREVGGRGRGGAAGPPAPRAKTGQGERTTTPETWPVRIATRLMGEHLLHAVLAALAVGRICGLTPTDIAQALEGFQTLPGRLHPLPGRDGLLLLDDSHNAAPASVRAALETLHQLAQLPGSAQPLPTVAVLGDLLRLGEHEREAHEAIGALAAQTTRYLVTHGERAEWIAAAARRAGLDPTHIAVTYTDQDAAAATQALLAAGVIPPLHGVERGPGGEVEAERQGKLPFSSKVPGREGLGRAIVLIKGSEELRMERVTERLLADPATAPEVLDRQTHGWKQIVIMRPDRPTWVEIDLGAIAANTQRIKALVGPQVEVLASLKADAYGHGALKVARTVLRNGASRLGLATVSEAVPLREASIREPLLIFGYTPPWQAREAVRLDLIITIYSLDTARALARAAQALGRPVRVHVKVDTGMGRLGLRAEDPEAIATFIAELHTLPGLIVEGIFTHFAKADTLDQTHARSQLHRFARVLSLLEAHGLRPPLVHAANSAATLTLPEARYDMVRPGIALYGLAPSSEVPLPPGFRPALAFKTQVAQVKEIPTGEGISYGATYVTTAPTRIAVLPVGYADGFRRAPRNWGEVLIRSQRAPILGRVCMDQCMVDVTHIPQARMGDEVVLIGRQGPATLTAEEVAERLGTINYEVVAEILARVPRVS
jgi:alanine racemase